VKLWRVAVWVRWDSFEIQCTWIAGSLIAHCLQYMFYVVCMQAVSWSLILKLIAQINLSCLSLTQKISLSMMTSQDHTCVQCVTNSLQGNIIWIDTDKYTLWKARTGIQVVNVREVFHHRDTNHTSVHSVANVSVNPATYSHMNVTYTATRDHITVFTVGSCLRHLVTWSGTFIFTLVQSRTHVDTVQNVLQDVNILSDICGRRTMKVLDCI